MKWIIETKIGLQKTAMIDRGQFYTYSELYLAVQKYKDVIQDRVGTGHVVAIVSDYNFQAIAAFFALYETNNMIIIITDKEADIVKQKIQQADCLYSLHWENGVLQIHTHEQTADVNSNPLIGTLVGIHHAGLILLSSGTTGRPKMMIHDLSKLIDTYQNKRPKGLVFLLFLMFDHIGGIHTLLSCVAMSAAMVIPESREPEYILNLISKYHINILPVTPTFLNLLLISDAMADHDTSSLRLITYGAEAMPESLLKRLRMALPSVRFLQTFGTSETGIMTTVSKSSDSTILKIADNNVEYKIVNGELLIKSQNNILGYLNYKSSSFDNEGWFYTGDLVESCCNGFIRIVGRSSSVINVGGEKVLPIEVEGVLYEMEDVSECRVYGEANPVLGQIVATEIFPKRKMSATEMKALVTSHCKGRLAKYKIPMRIKILTNPIHSARFKKK